MRRIAVLGAGRFGWSLARNLTKLGTDVLVLDSDEGKVNMADEVVARAVCVDVTNEEALKKLDIGGVDVAVLCIGDDVECSLLAATLLQRLGVREVWARAASDAHAQILAALGVDRIIGIEEEMGKELAYSLANPGMRAFMALSPEHSVVEIRAKDAWIGKSVREMAFRQKYGINVVAIKASRVETSPDGASRVVSVINDLPGADDVLKEGDTLVLIGPQDNIIELQRR